MNFFYKICDALCVNILFSNTAFIEEALKYLLQIAAKLTHSTTKFLTVSGDWQAEHTGWSSPEQIRVCKSSMTNTKFVD